MKDYRRSICSTCRHAPYCSLTTDMSNISSCSEYVHHLDTGEEPTYMVSIEMMGNNRQRNKRKEPVLN